jgi:hypothetical protein
LFFLGGKEINEGGRFFGGFTKIGNQEIGNKGRGVFLNRKTGGFRTGACKSLGSAELEVFFNRKTGEFRTGKCKRLGLGRA